MKNKFESLYERFNSWNGFVKLPILVIVFAICFLIATNSSTVSQETLDTPLQVYYFDVGQASSTLIIMPNGSSVMIDTGESETSSELVKSVEQILSKNGINELNFLVLTHSDADHVGGASAILARFNPTTIYRPLIASLDEEDLAEELGCLLFTTQTYQTAIQAVKSEGCKVEFISDISLSFGGLAQLTFYPAENSYYSESNSYCPYILLTYNDVKFLFTGDATQTREKEFLQMLSNSNLTINVDVLEVPHHGSKYSSTEDFLSAISPTYAVVSAGDSTHPSSEVLSRLQDAGVEEIYCTKTDGTVCIGVSENGALVFEMSSVYVDYPLIIVTICCLMFMVFYLIDEREKHNQIFLFRRKKQ